MNEYKDHTAKLQGLSFDEYWTIKRTLEFAKDVYKDKIDTAKTWVSFHNGENNGAAFSVLKSIEIFRKRISDIDTVLSKIETGWE
jgi:lipoprotein signal peptidase